MNREIWDQIKGVLYKKNNNKPMIRGLLDSMTPKNSRETSLGVLELEFSVTSPYHKQKIENIIKRQLMDELKLVYDRPFDFKVCVKEEKSAVAFEQLSLAKLSSKKSLFRNSFTFDSFVVGPNNEMAFSQSIAACKEPGFSGRNPLFIFGSTGLGKTHLLHAIGHYLEETSCARVVYASAENFLSECVSSIRNHQMERFRKKFRLSPGVLLIDDIHVLARGEHVQEEFFHTLNCLFDSKKQVVVTCDRLPRDIKGLKDRIRTRLEGGLLVDIQMPDLETKMAILEHKAQSIGLKLSSDILSYVASISKESIRELEGHLNKLVAFSKANSSPISLEFSKKVLHVHEPKQELNASFLLKRVAKEFGLSPKELKSKSRARQLVHARQMAMSLIQKNTSLSLKKIGEAFGDRDHTTVLHSIKKCTFHLENNSDFKKVFNKISKDIHRQ